MRTQTVLGELLRLLRVRYAARATYSANIAPSAAPGLLVSYRPLASSLQLFVGSSCAVGNISARARHSEESTVALPERWGAGSRWGAFGLLLAKQKNETFYDA